jgi:uncharacterized membrane protein YedE/YeeE
MEFLLAIVFSFLMGLVIQRGGTCTVAAINELIHKKTINRIRALIETAIWVLVIELILTKLSLIHLTIQNWQIIPATILGAFLLGIGAFINGACTIGTIARIGNREWDFLAMIPGFFVGAYLLGRCNLPNLVPRHLDIQSTPILSTWFLIIMGSLILLRGIILSRKGFHPYVLTILIGIFFLGLIIIDKAWSYTDLLVDLALFKHQNDWSRTTLFAALLIGAVVSGHFQDSKHFSLKKASPNIYKRFIGGAIMGVATFILPGSHDTLILLYMPMLLGYAWLGFIVMACTILICKLLQQKLEKT